VKARQNISDGFSFVRTKEGFVKKGRFWVCDDNGLVCDGGGL
jgi:hypothetical protein